ncbi:MAG: hypothetical protein N2491_09965 [Negativicutes bacterium]|nr:hypothetical protein [Negativicutes bacterium]
MFFTYGASVALISLAIYGLLCFIHDLWGYYSRHRQKLRTGVSLLLLVKDIEQDIEFLMRDLLELMEHVEGGCDAVVVDCGSSDLTYEIARRLAAEHPAVGVVSLPGSRPVNEAMPLCRGSVIHILDLIGRMPVYAAIPAASRLLRPEGRRMLLSGE